MKFVKTHQATSLSRDCANSETNYPHLFCTFVPVSEQLDSGKNTLFRTCLVSIRISNNKYCKLVQLRVLSPDTNFGGNKVLRSGLINEIGRSLLTASHGLNERP